MFNDHELELLISGLPDIDIGDLRANTEYSGYTAACPIIRWFWEAVQVRGAGAAPCMHACTAQRTALAAHVCLCVHLWLGWIDGGVDMRKGAEVNLKHALAHTLWHMLVFLPSAWCHARAR